MTVTLRLAGSVLLREEPQYFDSYMVYDTVNNITTFVDRPTLRLLQHISEEGLCADCLRRVIEDANLTIDLTSLMNRGWLSTSAADSCKHGSVDLRADGPLNWVQLLPREQRPVAIVSTPTQATVVITNRCDLSCLHCNVSAASLKGRDRVPGQRWAELLDELEELDIMRVILSGGEPFVHEEFPQILRHLASKRFHKSILTNGMHLTKEHIPILREGGITLTLSMDGGSAYSHDAFRRTPGSFARLLQTLALLRDADMSYNLVSVVHKRSIEEADKIVAVAHEHFAHQLFFVPLKAMGRGRTADQWVVEPEDYRHLQAQVPRLASSYPGLGVSFDENLEESEFGPTLEKAHFEDTPYGFTTCLAGRNGLVIDYDGKVYGCMVGMQTKVHPVGSVLTRSVMDVWQNGSWGIYRQPVQSGCRATALYDSKIAERARGRRLLPIPPLTSA